MKTGQKIFREFYLLTISFIIYLITYPKFIPVYGTGLDPSYVWALNYLVRFDYRELINLIYPVGPLGFLKYSAAFENNLAFSLLFFSVVKLSFIYLLLKLNYFRNDKISVSGFLLVLFIGYFSGIAYSLIGITVVSLILTAQKKTPVLYFVMANIAAFLGLMIKTTIGFPAYSAIFIFFLYLIFNTPARIKNLIIYSSVSVVVFFIGGMFVFRDVALCINYFIGILHLVGGYTSGLALYPENNWWGLVGFIVVTLFWPFAVKDKQSRLAFLLLAISLFAYWKLAMGREDVYHVKAMIGFLVVFWGIVLSSFIRLKIRFIFIPVLSILLFVYGIINVPLFTGYQINFFGINNFVESVIHYQSFDEKYKFLSMENVGKNKVDKQTASMIGTSTIDVYPWDLSYIPANGFHWKPRKTLEIGAATSSWLSHKNALSYQGENAPEFLLFHFQDDKWGGRFGSIDGRYILNDEPEVIFSLLKNYNAVERTGKYLLFRKCVGTNLIKDSIAGTQETEWDKWISIPKYNGITRIRFFSAQSLTGKIKSFFYKGETYYIDYRLSDGRILSYRFIADNAREGLWVNPFLLDISGNDIHPEVIQIRFRCSDSRMVKNKITISPEYIEVNGYQPAFNLFLKSVPGKRDYLFHYFNNYDTITHDSAIWVSRLDSTRFFSGKYCEKVKANGFSGALKIQLDTLWPKNAKTLIVEAGLMVLTHGKNGSKTNLVISLENTPQNFWISKPAESVGNTNEWQYLYLKKSLGNVAQRKGLLKVYIWNKEDTNIYFDNFTVNIYERDYKKETVK